MIELVNGNCLDVMKDIPDNSVNLILCDLPYGTTACKWDSVIPLDKLWLEYKRVIKKNGVIALTSLQPFTTHIISSNIEQFKYAYVWIKTRALGFQNAKLRPMTRHEDVLIFSEGNSANRANNLMPYYPQGLIRVDRKVRGKKESKNDSVGHKMARESHKEEYIQKYTGYPDTILNFPSEGSTVHPTQKPVSLMQHIILTYTNEGDIVLDNCMGSGTTGVACKNLNRKFIGIELDETFFNIAKERIEAA